MRLFHGWSSEEIAGIMMLAFIAIVAVLTILGVIWVLSL